MRSSEAARCWRSRSPRLPLAGKDGTDAISVWEQTRLGVGGSAWGLMDTDGPLERTSVGSSLASERPGSPDFLLPEPAAERPPGLADRL